MGHPEEEAAADRCLPVRDRENFREAGEHSKFSEIFQKQDLLYNSTLTKHISVNNNCLCGVMVSAFDF